MYETDEVYKMTLSKGMVILIGKLEEGDIAFIRKWLKRVEASQHGEAEPETTAEAEYEGEGIA